MGETHFIVGRSPVDGTFPFQSTVGMEEFLLRMVVEPEFVRRAIDAYVTRSIAYIEAMLDAGCDAIMTTDDYSSNRGPIMGAERFREFILPGIVRQAEAVHARGGYFIKHTDGNVWTILDDLIAAGIDGWHGIQPSIGMDLRAAQGTLWRPALLFRRRELRDAGRGHARAGARRGALRDPARRARGAAW